MSKSLRGQLLDYPSCWQAPFPKLDAVVGNSYQQQAAKLPEASLGQRLREIRARIVASSEGLSTIEESEKEPS